MECGGPLYFHLRQWYNSTVHMNEIIKNKLREYALFVWEVVKVVVISLVIIVPIRTYLIQPFYVRGASMEPNFHNFEYLIIDEIGYRFNAPQRGDVVVLRNDDNPSLIKRIIGLPGETVEIRDGQVLINGEVLNESAYLPETTNTTPKRNPVQLSEDEYYVLGDNRPESLDSRFFGPKHFDEIIGHVWIRAWPLNAITRFTHVEY